MPRPRTRPFGDASLPTADALTGTAPPAGTAVFRQFLEQHYGTVADAVRFVGARNHLSRDMIDELKSRVLLHLTQHDYAVLRQWRQEGSLLTYLVTVVTRVFLDYRNQEWGKVKPPALARRLGPTALMLWRLTHRKRITFDEAVTTLHGEHGVLATRDELWRIYVQFPVAAGRYFVDLSELEHREQDGADAEVLVTAAERAALAVRVERALADALDGLDVEARLIVKLFFHDGLSRAEISRVLHLDQQRLYPRFLALIARLKGSLEGQGITIEDVRQIVAIPNLDARPAVIAQACKTSDEGPSHRVGGATTTGGVCPRES
jgi:RNA polymerase sigma factor (sigma-70 family)